jgi:hypothetical protein
MICSRSQTLGYTPEYHFFGDRYMERTALTGSNEAGHLMDGLEEQLGLARLKQLKR